ncbi:ferredoxin-NADPH reductase [Micromonospora craniellae]|uniref:Ferredoxin-NADPH reductase n=1 Tax=Micromonospora craniellae TaxID=2294034 RepID=A0A372FZQ1_9ACTN|nr:ferredoxin-NADPH reductase [Micromonospora craniellae]QOC91373.1 ferredoxin-NADPH reductase [Micromonospora craniellae]RFS46301.1 ferredoxin-NADPH reductase [Micromonospora craniellae]
MRHHTIQAIFDGVYTALVTNMLLVAGGLPLVLLALTTDSTRAWPLYALTAPLCAPGLCGIFAVMSAYTAGHTDGPLRTFGRAWRSTARPAMLWGAAATVVLVVLGVDAYALWGHRIGALTLPILAMLTVLTVATTLLGLVVIAEQPAARLHRVARACLYLAVRRWYLTVASLLVLALLAQLVTLRPALALGLAAAPLLYVVWANSRHCLRAALDPPTRTT